MLKLSPGQWELRKNHYYASLLGAPCSPELLEEITGFHDEFKAHPDVVTTYALALQQSGDSGSAAKILLGLDAEIRKSASVAPFCAMIFSAAGDQERAGRYRKLPHRLFFPEEKVMLAVRR